MGLDLQAAKLFPRIFQSLFQFSGFVVANPNFVSKPVYSYRFIGTPLFTRFRILSRPFIIPPSLLGFVHIYY